MIQQELVAYLKQAKAEGHSLQSVKQVLTQLGWSEQDINDSALFASAPSAPSQRAPQAPVAPKKPEKKIPDYYISPLSILLAIILFLSLYALTGQIIHDVESVVAPYAADRVALTPAYQALSEKSSGTVSPDDVNRLQGLWDMHHTNDRIRHLYVVGILSAVFWVIAFAIHYAIGGSRPQYLPLSMPFFVTAALYLIRTLLEVISRLFEKDAQYAIYVTLIIFIIIITVAFMLYQKRSHTEKPL